MGSGAQVVFYQSGEINLSGLSLTPSSVFSLTGFTLSQQPTVTNPFSEPYISRVYDFASAAPVFSGTIRFYYSDAELNGIDESSLQLIVHNGSAWQLAGTSTVNSIDNFVEVSGISNLPLDELILATSLPLPLKWISVSASRQQTTVIIKWITEQEQQVSHFDVLRSVDGQHWSTAIAGIPATNQLQRKEYQQTDRPDNNGPLYYRVRQTDVDGRYTFSTILKVGAGSPASELLVLPNPASGYFMLSGIAPGSVTGVELFNSSGALVKRWNSYQSSFHVSGLLPGTYLIRIVTKENGPVNRQLIIRK